MYSPLLYSTFPLISSTLSVLYTILLASIILYKYFTLLTKTKLTK